MRRRDPDLADFGRLMDSLAGRDVDYDPCFLIVVMGLMDVFSRGERLPGALRSLFQANTTLLPPEYQSPTTMSALSRDVTSLVEANGHTCSIGTSLKIDDLADDDTFRIICPPQMKTDLSVRKMRAADLQLQLRELGHCSQVLEAVSGLDYIFACNVILAVILYQDTCWWRFWYPTGVFKLEGDEARKVLKDASDMIKKAPHIRGLDQDTRVLFYENNVLYGCINPPVPGFDEVAQTEELSHGRGEPHGLRDTGGGAPPDGSGHCLGRDTDYT